MASRPDTRGYFGDYGGRFVPETLMAALDELERAYHEASADQNFQDEFQHLCREYIGRPTPLYYARQLSEQIGGAVTLLKREDLAHTGAHKINNAVGQALLAKRMGKKRVIAETGAGQHGVAVAAACALLGLKAIVYMGAEDIERQSPNVHRMELMGTEVRSVAAGSRTLKDAINEAIRDWVTNVGDTYYLLGSVVGPRPTHSWSAIFSRSSAGRQGNRCWLSISACLTIWWPASAGAATVSACFILFSMIKMSNSSASRPPDAV